MKKTFLIFLGILLLNTCMRGVTYAQDRASLVLWERQPVPDPGNGYYRNPIVAGNYADPSLVRIDSDYYMIHGGGRGYGIQMWHSRDLVNWEPFAIVPIGNKGRPWAPDLVRVNGKLYIYVTQTVTKDDGTRSFENFVYHADRPEGPWNGPVDLGIKGIIDPGHLTAIDGKRYLYFEKGRVVQLQDDGLSTVGEFTKVYDGWDYPDEWVVECPCLEGPKFLTRDGYYYMISAMGGTAGPSTSHMATVARSKDPLGPWKESPYNPMIHTYSVNEKWWSQGHATLIDAVDGSWWAVYHGYEKDNRNMGRQTLMLPVAWTGDGWPVIQAGIKADALIKKPGGENIGHGLPLSDDFSSDQLGMQWIVQHEDLEKLDVGNKRLVLEAIGSSIKDAWKIKVHHVNHSFEVTVRIEVDENSEGGILLGNTGVGIRKGELPFLEGELIAPEVNKWTPVLYNNGRLQYHRTGELDPFTTNEVYLKIRNIKKDISLYYSANGKDWTKFKRSFRTDQIQPALYAIGKSSVIFREFKYLGLD